MNLTIRFESDVPAGPLVAELPEGLLSPGAWLLRNAARGVEFAAEVDESGLLYAILPGMAAGQVTFQCERLGDRTACDLRAERADQAVSVYLRDDLFATFRFGDDLARPCVWPLKGPAGLLMTRAWPLSDDDPDESRDHPHHTSFWVAHGDVNGVDHWSLADGHGLQRVRGLAVDTGPVCSRVEAQIDWMTPDGQRQLSERRKLVFWAETPGARFIDLTVRFDMTEGPVRFGDTKEGGLCSIRVASSMEEKRGQGTITNGAGGRTEAACWGKPAAWCDYCGTVAGQTAGIAILDHPGNFRHPTPWHVRAYGLMTANPFGLSYFTGEEGIDGSHTWHAGQAVEFRYRLLLHLGDAEQADIDRQWRLFAGSAKVVA